jgi:hypothetical protein
MKGRLGGGQLFLLERNGGTHRSKALEGRARVRNFQGRDISVGLSQTKRKRESCPFSSLFHFFNDLRTFQDISRFGSFECGIVWNWVSGHSARKPLLT